MLEDGHGVVCGGTGMGKSFWVMYQLVQMLLSNRAFAYFDPQWEIIRALYNFFIATEMGRSLWRSVSHRFVIVNPVSASGRIVGFNALAPVGDFEEASVDKTALMATLLTDLMRKESGFEVGDAMRMQHILTNSIGLLYEGGRGEYTLAELPKLFVCDKDPLNPFVRHLLHGVHHLGVQEFWRHDWPHWTSQARRDWVESSLNRIRQLIFNESILCTVCTVENARLDFRQIIDRGQPMLVNLPSNTLAKLGRWCWGTSSSTT